MLDWLTRAAFRRDAPRLPGSPPLGHGRFPLFDSLRAIAALAVVAYHIAGQTRFGGVQPYVDRLNVGVTIFFVISGFLLYRPFVRAHVAGEAPLDAGAYAWRRVLRIVPAYWVALTAISIWLGRDRILSGHGATFLLFGQIYRPDLYLGGIEQAWSLCVEVVFYAFLPLWALLVRARSGRGRTARLRREWLGLLALVLISFAYKQAVVLPHPRGAMEAGLPRFLDWFAVGMGLAVASVAYEGGSLPRPLRPLDRFPALGLLFAAIPYWVVTRRVPLSAGTDRAGIFDQHYLFALVALGVVAPAVLGNQSRGLLRRVLANRLLLWAGLGSYAIYLWHAAVIEQLGRWGTPAAVARSTGVNVSLAWVVLTLAPTLAIAALSWVAIERPVLRLKGDVPWRGPRRRREETRIVGVGALVLLVAVLAGGPFGEREWLLALSALAALACLATPVRRRLAATRLRRPDVLVLVGVVATVVAALRFDSSVSSAGALLGVLGAVAIAAGGLEANRTRRVRARALP